MSLPEGPHCVHCKHYASCVLAQREEGRPCGWYNARVQKLLRKAPPPKHTLHQA